MSDRLSDDQLDGIWSRASVHGIPVNVDWTKRLVREVRALKAERDRLRQGIAWLTESYHPPEVVGTVLRSLLDGEVADE